MPRPVYQVSQVNAYVKRILSESPILSRLRMTGEISNFKRHSSGHLYFALKDSMASINAVMFAADAGKIHFVPQDGMKVLIEGEVSLYERTGSYQLYVRRMEPDGEGALFQAFEAMKRKLSSEGLFDSERKKKIPAFARTIALVTSPTGAALQDMIRICRRRYPGVQLVLCPVLVQGENAADSIVQGLKRADTCGADVILCGRGGGSIEDLWPFNEEKVGRALAGMKTPVISAVGHETDFTIADFCADLRASTPSAAAELACPDISAYMERLDQNKRTQQQIGMLRIRQLGQILDRFAAHPAFSRPERMLDGYRLHLDQLNEKLEKEKNEALLSRGQLLDRFGLKLSYLDPELPLQRGYAYLSDETERVLGHLDQLVQGMPFRVHLAEGRIYAHAEKIEECRKED